jgi:maltooligosyltrehalose trehalohydrolase
MKLSAQPSLGLGAHCTPDGVTYRVWAPEHRTVRVLQGSDGLVGQSVAMAREEDGYFVGHDPEAKAGDLYRFYLDESVMAPDPASRYQPFGVFGPSMIVDSHRYNWNCRSWLRPPMRGRVIYELHVGTFSKAGTFRGAIEHLDHLAELGVNTIELMPIHDFPGRWNWGYDGVMLYAPARCYGTPDDLRALVDAAHTRGLAVMLDVVFNHFGPTGNPLPVFSKRYFHDSRETVWGRSLNFDGPDSQHVRDFLTQNAFYWLDEFRFDGLRLDATHAITDESPQHLMAEIREGAHARGAFLIAEDERNEATIVSNGGEPGWGFDGVWADDFHHTVRVALTGDRDGHFGSFNGTLEEWIETLRHGWLYRGAIAPHLGKPRGTPCGDLPPERFVYCISNHDQVGNRALGERLNHLVSPEIYRAVSMLICLTPYTPMLFMGQEWSASSPFLYFTDHPGELGRNMARYRRQEFEKVGINRNTEMLARMPDPQEKTTFASSALRWDERDRPPHASCLALYRECLNLRARVPTFQNPRRETWRVEKVPANRYVLRDGLIRALPAQPILAIRWSENSGDWLFLLNLEGTAEIVFTNHPFTSPTGNRHWEAVILSNDFKFGGQPGPGGLSNDRKNLKFDGPAAGLLRET